MIINNFTLFNKQVNKIEVFDSGYALHIPKILRQFKIEGRVLEALKNKQYTLVSKEDCDITGPVITLTLTDYKGFVEFLVDHGTVFYDLGEEYITQAKHIYKK